jgi:glutamate N-acetyltransferase/amino-acid N-acetyltransferase
MIEPNLATMLVYILTDIAVPACELRPCWRAASMRASTPSASTATPARPTPSCSISPPAACPATIWGVSSAALHTVCRDLAEDVVRNGEGVRHVIRVSSEERVPASASPARSAKRSSTPRSSSAPSPATIPTSAASFRRSASTSEPTRRHRHLSHCALQWVASRFSPAAYSNSIPAKEAALVAHLERVRSSTQSKPGPDGVFSPPIDFPPHERASNSKSMSATAPRPPSVLGGDLTHEYVSENADYRS